jgi:hypothetical protein
VYRKLLGGFRAGSREMPKDHYGREITADEFLARCWDWRVQSRFQLTPVGLRVPPWAVYIDNTKRDPPAAPLLLREVWKMVGKSYGGPQGDEHGLYKHIFAVVEIPRGAGVPDWYWRDADKGGIYRNNFPPMDKRVGEALNKWENPEFTSLAYWQLRLVCKDQDHPQKAEVELPVRGIWPMDLRRGVDAAGVPVAPDVKPAKFELNPELARQIKECRLDNIAAGNISLLRAPRNPNDPWYFRVMFYGKDPLFKDLVYIRYVPAARDTRDLADADARARMTVRTDAVRVRDLDNSLLIIEPPPRHAWWKRVGRGPEVSPPPAPEPAGKAN